MGGAGSVAGMEWREGCRRGDYRSCAACVLDDHRTTRPAPVRLSLRLICLLFNSPSRGWLIHGGTAWSMSHRSCLTRSLWAVSGGPVPLDGVVPNDGRRSCVSASLLKFEAAWRLGHGLALRPCFVHRRVWGVSRVVSAWHRLAHVVVRAGFDTRVVLGPRCTSMCGWMS